MAFLEDPRLQQRWNQFSQTTETVAENAAAGIWSFNQQYINPCLGTFAGAFNECTTACFGDREERARRARERRNARRGAEYSFDFYDNWDEDLYPEEQGGGILNWRNEDWDRLLAGTGRRKGSSGEIHEQPSNKKRTMSYGTTRGRTKTDLEEDPTIIPSTSAIGILGRLPFKIGGTLRYKPSAANLKDHPGSMKLASEGENEPLLGNDHGESYLTQLPTPRTRKRSGTAGSGDTSDSYRSRGDLFPSDGEGDEDAVPLDDDLAGALDYMDDGSSLRTRSSKGKRIASGSSHPGMAPRSVSRTTLGSTRTPTRPSPVSYPSFTSDARSPISASVQSLDDLRTEEIRLGQQEEAAIEKQRQAAANLALRRGLSRENLSVESVAEVKSEVVSVVDNEVPRPETAVIGHVADEEGNDDDVDVDPEQPRTPSRRPPPTRSGPASSPKAHADEFVPARLPYFR